jgi:hypothetical protein
MQQIEMKRIIEDWKREDRTGEMRTGQDRAGQDRTEVDEKEGWHRIQILEQSIE